MNHFSINQFLCLMPHKHIKSDLFTFDDKWLLKAFLKPFQYLKGIIKFQNVILLHLIKSVGEQFSYDT
jgi:hypothetical protein